MTIFLSVGRFWVIIIVVIIIILLVAPYTSRGPGNIVVSIISGTVITNSPQSISDTVLCSGATVCIVCVTVRIRRRQQSGLLISVKFFFRLIWASNLINPCPGSLLVFCCGRSSVSVSV